MQAARKILSTRQGTLAFAAAAAALAIAVLLVFMQSYKRSLDQRADPVTVLVAKDDLPKGSSGDAIAGNGLFKATGFKREQVKEGAKETGHEALERGKEVAQEAAQSAKETVQERGGEQAEQLRDSTQAKVEEAGDASQASDPSPEPVRPR